MRYLACICTAVLLASCYTAGVGQGTAPARQREDAPQPRPNRITITTSDSPEAAYRRIGQILVGRGYAIAQSDPALLILTTEPRELGSGVIRITASVTDGDSGARVHVKGATKMGYNVGKALLGAAADEDALSALERAGMRGSPARRAWDEMEAVALAYPDAAITYARD